MPAPGTENDDKNPPRIQPRNLFDLAWATTICSTVIVINGAPQFTVVNLTNKYALYNFLSTFSGTHYVTREPSRQIGFHF